MMHRFEEDTIELKDLLSLKAAPKVLNQQNLLRKVHNLDESVLLFGTPIHQLEASYLISFICKAFAVPYASVSLSNLIAILLNRVRELIVVHSTLTNGDVLIWNIVFRELLIGSVYKCNPEATWRRLLRQLIVNDLEQQPNFTLTNSSVYSKFSIMINLVNAVADCDVNYIQSFALNTSLNEHLVLPQFMSILNLNHWTLLHYASSSNSPIHQNTAKQTAVHNVSDVIQFLIHSGSGLLDVDGDLRTPLHIACRSLNHSAIALLTSADGSARRMRDRHGHLPIHSLLLSVSMCPWRDKISSNHLINCIHALLKGEGDWLWEGGMRGTTCGDRVDAHNILYSTDSDDAISETRGSDSTVDKDPQSCLLYFAVAYTDDVVSHAALKLALTTPRNLWRFDVLTATIIRCCRQDRVSLIGSLLSDFDLQRHFQHSSQIGSISTVSAGQWMAFLDQCMCAAIVSDAHQALHLLITYYNVAVTELIANTQSADHHRLLQSIADQHCSFLFTCILRNNAPAARSICSVLDRDLLVAMVYRSKLSAQTMSTRKNYTTHNTFTPLTEEHSYISPLSLLCYARRDDVVLQIVLKATFSHARKQTTHIAESIASDINNSVKDSDIATSKITPHWTTAYLEPLIYCLLGNNLSGLRVLRNLLGVAEFGHMCFHSEYRGMTPIALFLQQISSLTVPQNLAQILRIKQSVVTVNDARRKRSVPVDRVRRSEVVYSDTIEVLWMLLGSLSVAPGGAKDSHENGLSTRIITSNSSSSTNTTCSSVVGIQNALDNINTQLTSLHHVLTDDRSLLSRHTSSSSSSSSSTHFAAHSSRLSPSALYNTLNLATAEVRRAVELSAESESRWASIVRAVKSGYFSSCVRILTRKLVPDKAWIRLSHCLLLLMNKLPSDAADSAPTRLDINSWFDLKRLLSNALKSDGGMVALRRQLLNGAHPLKHHVLNQNDSNSDSADITHVLSEQMRHNLRSTFRDQSLDILLPANKQTAQQKAQDEADHFMSPCHPKCDDRVAFCATLFNALIETVIADCELVHDLCPQLIPLIPQPTVVLANERKAPPVIVKSNQSITIQQYLQSLKWFERRETLEYCLCLAQNTISVPSLLGDLLLFGDHHISGDVLSNLLSGLRSLLIDAKHSGVIVATAPSVDKTDKRRHSPLLNHDCSSFLEHVILLLVEHNSRLGHSHLSLLQHVLPLTALGLWRAASAVVTKFASDNKSSVDVSGERMHNMSHVMFSSDELRGLDLLRQYEQSLLKDQLGNDGTPVKSAQLTQNVSVITPLHVAIASRQQEFIQLFLNTFPEYGVNLPDLMTFAVDSGVGDMCAVLARLSSIFVSDVKAHRPLVKIQTAVGWKAIDSVMHEHRISRQLTTRQSDVDFYFSQRLIGAAQGAADYATQFAKQDQVRAGDCFPFVTCTDNQCNNELQVVLLDGSTLSYSKFISYASHVARALPAPTLAGGLFHSGHTLLHHAAMTGLVDVCRCLLRSDDWAREVLSVDFTGRSPLFHAVQGGHLELAHSMLDRLSVATKGLDDTPSTSDGESVSKAAHMMAAIELQSIETHQSLVARIKRRPDLPTNSPLYYGMRGCDATSPLDLLSITLQSIETMWNFLQTQDLSCLLRVSGGAIASELDSVIRARQLLTVIGVPISQLVGERPAAHQTLQEGKDQRKQFSSLSVKAFRRVLSHLAATQLRTLLTGWYQSRNTSARHHSALADCWFHFRCLETSFVDIGCSGQDIRQYFSANGRRTRNIRTPANDRQVLNHQLQLELRCDVDNAFVVGSGRENMPHSANRIQLDSKLISHFKDSPSGGGNRVELFLHSIQVDLHTLQNTLKIAYLLLDFGRLLLLARSLVEVTNTSDHSSAGSLLSATHPLDTLHANANSALENCAQTKQLLVEIGKSSKSITAGGINSRIRICDFTTTSSLQSFLSLSPQVSSRFNAVRSVLIEGLTALFSDEKRFRLSEWLCRLSSEEFSTDNEPSTESKLGEEKITPSSKFKRLTSLATGCEELLVVVRKYKVSDFQAIDTENHENLLKFCESSVHKLSSVLLDEHGALVMSGDEELRIVHSTQEHKDSVSVLNALQQPQFLTASQLVIERATSKLSMAYSAATDLLWLFKSMCALVSGRHSELYRHDAQHFAEAAKSHNPLNALCDDSSLIGVVSEHKIQSLSHLLALGFDARQADTNSACAVEIAAVNGQSELLQILLRHRGSGIEGSSHMPSSESPLLVWHVLMQCPSVTHVASHHAYTSCLETLLQQGFAASSPQSCDHSCLDLACMKQLPSVARLICLQMKSNTSADNSNTSSPSGQPSKRSPKKLPLDAVEYVFRSYHYLLLWPKVDVPLLQMVLSAVVHESASEPNILAENISLHGQLQADSFAQTVVKLHANSMTKFYSSRNSRKVDITSIQENLHETVSCFLPTDIQRRNSSEVFADLIEYSEGDEEVIAYNLLYLCMASRDDRAVGALLEKECFGRQMSLFINDSIQADVHALQEIVSSACYYGASAVLHFVLHVVRQDTNEYHSTIVRELFSSGAYCRQLDKTLTPLEVVLLSKTSNCLSYLLYMQADVSLSAAVKTIVTAGLREEAMVMLLSYAVNATFDPESGFARFRQQTEFRHVSEFLSAVSHTVGSGRKIKTLVESETLLHVCCRRGYVKLVEYLCHIGADPMVSDAHQNTALQCGIASGHKDITRMLYRSTPPTMRRALSLMAYAIRRRLLQRAVNIGGARGAAAVKSNDSGGFSASHSREDSEDDEN